MRRGERARACSHIGVGAFYSGRGSLERSWLLPLKRQPRMRTAGDTKAPASLHQVGMALRSRVMPSAAGEALEQAVGEAHVSDRARDLALLDEEAPVARQPGHHGAARLEQPVHVVEAADVEAAIDAREELVHARRAPRPEHERRRRRCRRPSRARGAARSPWRRRPCARRRCGRRGWRAPRRARRAGRAAATCPPGRRERRSRAPDRR